MQGLKDDIHIVYASDDLFAPILGVSMASVLRAGVDVGHFDITVFDGGISRENRRNLDNICREYGSKEPEYIHHDYLKELLGEHIQTDRGSTLQYARLFIGRLMYDRIIYLDCDVMVRKPIADLWKTDLQGMTAAAVPDLFSRYYYRGMELGPEDTIYNYGVMLADLVKWREQKVEEKATAFIRRHSGSPIKSDLGALNAVLSKDTLPLYPDWNAMNAFYDFTYEEMLYYRKPPEYFPKDVVMKAAADPKAVHFTSSFCSVRPWEEGCSHPFTKEYEAIKRSTPWAETLPARVKRSLMNRLLNKIPWRTRIHIAALLQAYIRPLSYSLKERIKKVGR